ncbi:hypothetical protein PG994_010106 [Apiospora phragmitis]|uniref:DUF6594 domain-containing protein n=1 Tax=Apiospora phragmitis TaxID=2905665 RepID=A0ABR1TP03_9PEZI
MDSDQVKTEESGSVHRRSSMPHLPDLPTDEHDDIPPAGALPSRCPARPRVQAATRGQYCPVPKSSKAALNKRKTPSSDVVVLTTSEITKLATSSTTRSDATGAELDHDLRIEEKRRRQEFPRRLLTAVVGGIFVIVPMVVMSIGRTLTKCLITSTVAILLFGFTLAWCSTSDEAAVFIATAGYAAFLAVFVAVGDD